MPSIHPTAIIDPSADVAQSAQIGAYCVVGARARIGEDCVLRPHSQVGSLTEIGVYCHEFGHALGLPDLYDTSAIGGAARRGGNALEADNRIADAQGLAVDHGDDHMAMGRRNGAVDEHQVAAIDAELVHGIPGDAHQEGGLRMRHEDVVQIQPRDAGVAGRRTKADGHAGTGGAGTGTRIPADADQVDIG